MEGYTDVILAHQFGVRNAVATCGTALTEGHLNLLRQAERISVLFDGDVPGLRAAERALELMVKREVNADIVILPDDLDPADFLVAHGAEPFLKVLENSRGIVEFKLDALRDRYDFHNPIEQRNAASECLELVMASPSPVLRDSLIQRFAEGIGLSVDALRREAQREAKKHQRRPRDSAHAPPMLGDPPGIGAAGENADSPTDSMAAGSARATGIGGRFSESSLVWLEETALACAIMEPALAMDLELEFGTAGFPDADLQAIAEAISEFAGDRDHAAPSSSALVAHLFGELGNEARQRLVRLIAQRIGEQHFADGADDSPDEGILGETADPRVVFGECVAERRRRLMATEAKHLRDGLRGQGIAHRATPDHSPAAPLPTPISEDARQRAQKHLELLRQQKGRSPGHTPAEPPVS